MKILFVSDYYPSYGGRVVYEVAKRLANKNISTKVISSEATSNLSRENNEKEPYVNRLKSFKMILRDTSYIVYCPINWSKIEKDLNVDIIHLHFLYGFLPIYVSLIKRIKKLKIPTIITSHGATVGYTSNLIQGAAIFLNELSHRIVVSNASAITTVSKMELYSLRKKVPNNKLTYIPNGVDTSIFKPDSYKRAKFRESLGYTERDFVVLFFAQLRAAKGVSIFLNSISKIVENTKNIKFLVVGSGPLSDLVEKTERKFPDKLQTILNYVPDEDVPYLYNASDLYVLPSFVEGMPLSVMEAMATGKPVIVTNIADLPILVKNGINGIVIPTKNSDLLAKKIIFLSNNAKLRKKMSCCNIRKMKSYDWDEITSQYQKLYKKILSS